MTPAGDQHFLDAGRFIGAILLGDPRHSEAYPLLEAARRGDFRSCTSVGVLSEVYGALTWTGSATPHTPADAARSVRELVCW
jgi:predicted nucleic acid-binding protein